MNAKITPGARYGSLTVLRRMPPGTNAKAVVWVCRCDCGKETRVLAHNLHHDTRSCGCETRKRQAEAKIRRHDKTGQRFGRLVVLSHAGIYVSPKGARMSKWKCRCDCGKITNVLGNFLISKKTRSCGCYNRDQVSLTHSGANNVNWKGGISKLGLERDCHTRKYREWRRGVFERHGKQCVVCGSQKNIRTHHLNSWEDHEEQRFDVSNGMPICESCHQIFHSAKWYGYRQNTKEQFEEFYTFMRGGGIMALTA